jgi:TetR/AcrR family transcriptional regulator, mexJK operon transcriptional repressor
VITESTVELTDDIVFEYGQLETARGFLMNSLKTGRTVGRPAEPELAVRILDVSWQMFLQHGVNAVTVEAVAAQAGVSKSTFYKHFSDKAALFEASVLREMERIEAAQQLPIQTSANVNANANASANGNLHVSLRQFGIGLMRFFVSPGAVDFYKALSGELAQHPRLAKRFYDLGPGRTKANLAALLAVAAAKGELAITNPEEAAEHLIGLWQGLSNFQLALGIHNNRIRTSIPARVEAGLGVFMTAYATTRTNTPPQRPQR